MARPQNAPKGLLVKAQANLTTAVITTATITTGTITTGTITTLTVDTACTITPVITSSGGITLPTVTSLPAARIAPGTTKFITNGTGSGLVLNTTGTTWVYLNTTTVQA